MVEPDQSTDTPDPDSDHLFCVAYYPSVKNISVKANSTKHPLSIIIDMDDADTCADNDDLLVAENKFAFINGSIGNCSIADRAKRIQKYKAAGLITDRIISDKYNSSHFNISIEVLTLVDKNAKQRIKEFQKEYPEGYFYVNEMEKDETKFDASIVVVSVMALVAVVLGSFWSGHTKQKLRLKKEKEGSAEITEENPDRIQPLRLLPEEGLSTSIKASPWFVFFLLFFFVVGAVGVIVLTYFFPNQLGESIKSN